MKIYYRIYFKQSVISELLKFIENNDIELKTENSFFVDALLDERDLTQMSITFGKDCITRKIPDEYQFL
jgi:6-phosphogluconate dehydrogenase